MTYKVRIVGDTVSPHVTTARITSFEIYAPRFLLAEINTHRLLAKSAQSSRAVPVAKRIQNVIDDPYVPEFGRNNKGMQSISPLDAAARQQATNIWVSVVADSVRQAGQLADTEVHKQWANRVLEPYCHFYGVITGTEWDNFWNLRTSESAQPEFRALAKMMLETYWASTPIVDDYHLPYIEPSLRQTAISSRNLMGISSARCARVSYKNHDGSEFSVEKDLNMCDSLIAEGHLSPFDHPASADQIMLCEDGQMRYVSPEDHRQFWGWRAYRVEIECKKGWKLRRDSHAAVPDEFVRQAA